MSDLQEQMLLAICKPENKVPVPYGKTKDGKDKLYRWQLDQNKSAEKVTQVAEQYTVDTLKKFAAWFNEEQWRGSKGHPTKHFFVSQNWNEVIKLFTQKMNS